jgi:hypothetical protein
MSACDQDLDSEEDLWDEPRLNPALADVGLLEPTSMPDTLAAMNCIDNFTNMVSWYGEECTWRVLRRCCTMDIAQTWLFSLSDDDRAALQSTRGWERLIRRDFMPRRDILECEARAETFKWTQGRTPSAYATHKMKLLRNGGITDPDVVVQEIHDGFARCPELQLPLEHMVLDPMRWRGINPMRSRGNGHRPYAVERHREDAVERLVVYYI